MELFESILYKPLEIPNVSRLILFRLHLNFKIFSCDCFKRIQETGWAIMDHNKSRIIHGSIRSIGMPYWASQLSHHLCRFCLQTLIYQILTNNSQVVRLSHTVRIQEEWMKKGRISLDFHLKIIDFVYFTLIWLIFYHFFRIALSRLIFIDKSYRFYLKYKGKRNYKIEKPWGKNPIINHERAIRLRINLQVFGHRRR